MRKNQEYFWKIVSYNPVTKKMESYASICSDANVEYELNKTTVPKIGKLFLFSTRKHARAFSKCSVFSHKTHKILKCKVTNPQYAPEYIIQYTSLYSYSILNKYWKLSNVDDLLFKAYTARSMDHTILCDSCTPVEISR